MKKALTLVLVVSIFVSVGCTTTPKTRFPEYYEAESRSPNVDVIIDTIVLSDIAGSDIGINKEKNSIAHTLVSESVPSVLDVRGYSPNILYSGNGEFLELNEEIEYFISEDFKSTNVPYTGPDETEISQTWANEDIFAFIKRLSEYAPYANKKQKNSSRTEKSKDVEISPITIDEVPESIMQSPSDTLLFIRAYAGDISMSKSVGAGLATGLLTAALTGGMYVYVAAPISGSRIEVIAFDKKATKIVWHNFIESGDYKNLDRSIKRAMKLYPTTTNAIYKKPRSSK